jgi:type I restriction enzyme, S subunit
LNFRTNSFTFIFSLILTEKSYLRQAASTQDNLNLERLNSLIKFIPPLSEQKAIGHYLDTKTAQIDRKIDLLTQKATLYGNLKQSLINETVTRGLDKSVAMKDSGIESIGEVPENWSIGRIKEVAWINKSTLSEKTPNNYEFDYVDIGSVTYGVKKFYSERMTFENSPSRAKRIVSKGDTIISTVRTYLKAITYIDYDASNLIVSTGFAVISPKKVLFSKYFSYLSTSNFVVDETCASSTGVSYPAINSSVIADLFCLIPPLPEQKEIADYLDTKTAKIDQITQTINTQIEKLQELRKTLINDVVTGKIKVT